MESVLYVVKVLYDVGPPTMIVTYDMRERESNLSSNSRKRLFRRTELCEEFLEVLSKLDPGFSLMRGRLLRQLHVPSLRLAELKLKSGKHEWLVGVFLPRI